MAGIRATRDAFLWRAISLGHVRTALPHGTVEARPDVVALGLAAGTRGARFAGAPLKDVDGLPPELPDRGDRV